MVNFVRSSNTFAERTRRLASHHTSQWPSSPKLYRRTWVLQEGSAWQYMFKETGAQQEGVEGKALFCYVLLTFVP